MTLASSSLDADQIRSYRKTNGKDFTAATHFKERVSRGTDIKTHFSPLSTMAD